MALPSINTFPELKYPSFQRMGWSQLDTEETEGLAQLAAKQTEEERTGSNWFFDFLEFVQRPQSTVANIALDLVDGGTFNPFDRSVEALTGAKHVGFADVINQMFPDEWARGTLPSWLGGAEMDLAKEGVGLVADMMTDPLSYMAFGTRLGKVLGKPTRKITGGELSKFATEAMPKSKLWKPFKRAETEAMEGAANKIGAPHPSMLDQKAAMVRTHAQLAHWDRTFKHAIANPTHYADDPAMIEWLQQYQQFHMIDSTKGIWEEFAEGSRGVALRIPFTQIQVSMLPSITKMVGEGMSSVTEGMWHGVFKTPRLKNTIDLLKNTFIYRTGNHVLDQFIHKAQKNIGFQREEFKKFVDEMKELFPPNMSKGDVSRTLDLIERPYDLFGWQLRTDVTAEQVAIAKKVWGYMEQVGKKEKALGLQRGLLKWGQPLTLKKSWENARGAAEKFHNKFKEGGFDPATYFRHGKRSWRDVERRVDMIMDRFTGAGRQLSRDEARAFRSRLLKGEAIKDMKRIQNVIGDGNPPFIEGYFPRFRSRIAQELLYDFMRVPQIMYGRTQAYKFFSDRMLPRKLKDISLNEFNEMFAKGATPYDFLNDVVKQVQGMAEKSPKLKKKLYKFYKEMGADQFIFFEDNPVLAVMNRGLEHIKITNNAELVSNSIKVFGRPLDKFQPNANLGESAVLGTPFGMQAMYGKNWRSMLDPTAMEWYDSLLKNNRMTKNLRLDEAFIPLDAWDINDAHRAGVPLFAMNKDVFESMNKVVQFRTTPQEMNQWIGLYGEVTKWFKATTLAPFPGYHARNVAGQFFLGYLGGSVNLARPMWTMQNFVLASKFMSASNLKFPLPWRKGQKVAMNQKLLKKGVAVDSLDDLKITGPDGKVVATGRDLADIWNQDGLSQMSWYSAEFQKELIKMPAEKAKKLKDKAKKWAGAGLSEFSHKGRAIGGLFEFGSYIEGWQRMAQVIAELRNGASRFESVAKMKKYFFAFDELTTVERNALAEAVPFYNWIRHNLPLQAEMAVMQPNKYAQLGRVIGFLQTDEGKNFDKRKLPGWVNENFGVPLRVNKKSGDVELSLLRSWVPAMDLMAITSANPVESLGRDLGGMLHPFIKTPVEHLTNTNLFTMRDLEEFPGEPTRFLGKEMPKKLAHMAKNIRALSEIDRLTRDSSGVGELDSFQKWMTSLGITPKFKAFDVESLNKRLEFDRNQRAATLKRLYNSAKRDGDLGAQQYYRNLWEDVEGYEKATTK
jgi:hypothetical protein